MIPNVTLWIAILAAFSITAAIIYAAVKIRRFSREVFGTPDIAAGFRQQEEKLERTPKSVSAMTGIELPRIQRDFPEFSWPQWRQQAENQLLQYLTALEQRDVACLSGASPVLREHLRLTLADQAQQGIREQFRDIRIHRTEISRYEKAPGLCRILIQSSVEYRHSRTSLRADDLLQDKREQHRYAMELVYIQDPDKTQHDSAVAANCPNCGAPLSDLGAKHCPYCGAAVEPVNLRAWALQRIEKDL